MILVNIINTKSVNPQSSRAIPISYAGKEKDTPIEGTL